MFSCIYICESFYNLDTLCIESLLLGISCKVSLFWSNVYKCRNLSSGHSIASIHGAVLALTASVLSAPYDMPRCVTLS